MALFARSLRDLGAHVRYGGGFHGRDRRRGGSAAGLAQRSAAGSASLTSRYDDSTSRSFKRAQIAAADLHRAGGPVSPTSTG